MLRERWLAILILGEKDGVNRMKRSNWVSIMAISLIATAACGMITGITIVSTINEAKRK
ncbi:hypothetical protein RV10_GL002346 [Enterococcus pallens]|nr:hypothetical protein RV10_GL002346 [Enterococcus pallens]